MFLVIGAGVSGLGAVKLLDNLGKKNALYDKNKKKLKSIALANLIPKNTMICYKISKKLLMQTKTVVLSPGVTISKKINKYIKKFSINVIGELEFGAQYSKSTLIAVTGTNGKTTTTELANHILNFKEEQSLAVGNNGISICSVQNCVKKFLVCEASSFQLENAKTFHPHIACFLNFAPDHLNRYESLEEYFDAKIHIFDNQTKNDFAILSFDDEKIKTLKPKSKTIWISANQKLNSKTYSVWCCGSTMFIKNHNNIQQVDLKGINLFSGFNVYNVMFASAIGVLCGVPLNNIKKQIKSFSLPKHRCEFVAEINGVKFVNDSKATNIHATTNALKKYKEDIVLLLGGSSKGEDFKPFFQKMQKNVKKIITFGQVGAKLYRLAKKENLNVCYVKDFQKAVVFAKETAQKGSVVLLSPSCASFDCFLSYEQRGECFKFLITGEKFE